MKKSFMLFTALCMVVSLCACGRSKPAETTPTTVPTTVPMTTVPTTQATMPTLDPTLETNIPDPSVDTSLPDMTELLPTENMDNETTDMTTGTEDMAK